MSTAPIYSERRGRASRVSCSYAGDGRHEEDLLTKLSRLMRGRMLRWGGYSIDNRYRSLERDVSRRIDSGLLKSTVQPGVNDIFHHAAVEATALGIDDAGTGAYSWRSERARERTADGKFTV